MYVGKGEVQVGKGRLCVLLCPWGTLLLFVYHWGFGLTSKYYSFCRGQNNFRSHEYLFPLDFLFHFPSPSLDSSHHVPLYDPSTLKFQTQFHFFLGGVVFALTFPSMTFTALLFRSQLTCYYLKGVTCLLLPQRSNTFVTPLTTNKRLPTPTLRHSPSITLFSSHHLSPSEFVLFAYLLIVRLSP